MQQRCLQCFLRGHDDHWEAICIDFDIAVQGTSIENVQTALRESVFSYLADVEKEQTNDARRLRRRKAPFILRIKIIYSFILDIVSAGGRNGEVIAQFRMAESR